MSDPTCATRGTVLVADDEPQLLRLVARALRREGYHVIAAADGRQARAVFEVRAAEIGAAVLDVAIVPGGAADVVKTIRARRPEVGVILISGDDPSSALRDDLRAHGGRFLRKPFLPAALLAALREVLHEEAA